MKMFRNRWRSGVAGAALLAATAGGCDWIEPTTADPNNVGEAGLAQLFTGAQVNMFYLSQSIYARLATMWTQQTAGVQSQFTALDQYRIGEDDFDDEMGAHYTGGGLIDLRQAIGIAEEAGRRSYAGILKIHEAWLMGTAADVYGDVPYSQAVDPEVEEPALDPQLEVYAAVQALLDEAIADLAAGGIGPGAVDLNFGGDTACWTAVAYSLKARYYLHTAEVSSGAYQQALTNAENGISSVACNWQAIHTAAATETNIWHQFMRDRPDHIVGGAFLVNLLNGGTPSVTTDDDPRLAIYFSPATAASVEGQFVGSLPGAPAGDVDEGASPPNTNAIVAAGADLPIISCSETQFIEAEAHARAGNAGAARAAANAGLACQEARFGITLPEFDSSLSGNALLMEILEQKYIAQFLNLDVLADYERTCYPSFATAGGSTIPGRFFYGTTERQTNTNIPSVGEQRQTPRNANDPNPCT